VLFPSSRIELVNWYVTNYDASKKGSFKISLRSKILNKLVTKQ